MSVDPPKAVLLRHHALVPTDNPFQRRARLLQTLWREAQGLPIGEHHRRPLGSRLAMPDAKTNLTNYLTETIRNVVRAEVLDPKKSLNKLYGQPRIWNDLLSSQPLCFNLFAELQADSALAARVFRRLSAGRAHEVTGIEFEWSPGRGDRDYTGDRSAFDVFVDYKTLEGRRGFIALEVKYHEALGDPPAPDRARYDEVASAMGCFRKDALARLKTKPLQQIWRDHLLVGSLLAHKKSPYADGFFAFTHPRDNDACAAAIDKYRKCLASEATFVRWTLEEIVDAIRSEGAGPWIEAVFSRYLDFEGRLAPALAEGA